MNLSSVYPVGGNSELSGKYKYQVLEGNRRLAALRVERKGTLPTTHVMCHILNQSQGGMCICGMAEIGKGISLE